MSNSYRIRTTPGVDKSIKVRIDQDFEYLEILSLKLLQNEVYTRKCSDYGVIVGRISINNGFGIPNAKVSVFVPLSKEDEKNNPVISSLYPYTTLTKVNDDGYSYNLLPTEKSYSNHVPTGSFFTRNDVLTNVYKYEVFEKYYKYTAITNESGDYMIFGVPLGSQTIVVNVDLSDIGEFSLAPQDLIRMGVATEQQVGGTKFNSSNNFNELPQIVTLTRTIEVQPFWGDENICVLGLTRTDFDLSAEKNITIKPTAVFMGSIISSNDDQPLNRKCKPTKKMGMMCNIVTSPGEIQAIRQNIYTDINGRPGLEVATLEDGGKVIDDNGTWMIDVPMNLDYVVTNEFGELVISKDPTKGIPTKGKYRFKILWTQSPDLSEKLKRGTYLVPNIKEYGWTTSDGTDPYTKKPVAGTSNFGNQDNPCEFALTVDDNTRATFASYAFSLDWDDYGQKTSAGQVTPLGLTMINEAINCQDRFFEMRYNKVYTVSQLISEYRKGSDNNRFIGIKHILEETCESTNNKFPVNDSVYRVDIIFILFQILMLIIYVIFFALLWLFHLFTWLLCTVIKPLILLLKNIVCGIANFPIRVPFCCTLRPFQGLLGPSCDSLTATYEEIRSKCENSSIDMPMITYPDCELCACEPVPFKQTPPDPTGPMVVPNSPLGDIVAAGEYKPDPLNVETLISGVQPEGTQPTNYATKGLPRFVQPDGDRAEIYKTQIATTDLPWHERINLFNTKAKYFKSGNDNPGGGVNQIMVRYNVDDNGGPLNGQNGLYHLDNVIAVLIDDNESANYPIGQLLTFVDPTLTKDKNLIIPYTNDFGTNSILGKNVGTDVPGKPDLVEKSVKLTYSNPNQSGLNKTLDVTYKIKGKKGEIPHKFPIDMEYYQVIHNESVQDYLNLANSLSPDLTNSFFDRCVNANSYQFYTEVWPFSASNCLVGRYYTKKTTVPLGSYFPKFTKLRVVFMVRGVDPNSPKTKISYDLSKLYGKSSWNSKVVTHNDMRMNIPIQGGFKNVKHSIGNSTIKDTYSDNYLFHDTFMWVPAETTPEYAPNEDPLTEKPFNPSSDDPEYRPPNWGAFKSFTTQITNFYSLIDNDRLFLNNWLDGSLGSSTKGLYMRPVSQAEANDGKRNGHLIWFDNSNCNSYTPILNSGGNNRGYFNNEIVEGGNIAYIQLTNLRYFAGIHPPPPAGKVRDYESLLKNSIYYSYTYESAGGNPTLNVNLGNSKRQIVMRSDRLPSSSFVEKGPNDVSYTLMANNNFSIYQISDDGSSSSSGSNEVLGTGQGADNTAAALEDKACGNNLITTFSCEGLVPLSCYYPNGKQVFVHDLKSPIPDSGPGSCYGNGVKDGAAPNYGRQPKPILEGGCYKLVTAPFRTMGRDYELLIEWRSRMVINFAACRNVFAQYFTNNWINGTLYHFSFVNSRRFTPPNKNSKISNKPYNCFCKNNLILHPTNNFYYRSSPWNDTNGFIGRNAPKDWVLRKGYGNNVKNLMWPTTIMDLGPRDKYTQELVYSNDYDGYVMRNLNTTTFQDVSELINTFILSRITNRSFVDAILAAIGTSAVFKFFSRENKKVDGDYAQSVSINSELGTIGYGEDNYTSCDLYFNGGSSNNGVFGVFYKTNNQVRDFITPKRNIISDTVMIDNTKCGLEPFNVKTQVVPFYQWHIQPNFNNNEKVALSNTNLNGGNYDSIFGSQQNEWLSEAFSGLTFFYYGYQNLDRLLRRSRYFRPRNPSTQYYRSAIFTVDNNGKNSGSLADWDFNLSTPGGLPQMQRVVNTGAPYFFYFGLNKGKSAFDRFTKKWVEGEIITDDNG